MQSYENRGLWNFLPTNLSINPMIPKLYKQDFHFFSENIELINNHIGFQKINGIVYYFNGAMPVFQHPEKDYASFRLFTSQFVVNGNVRIILILSGWV